MHHYVAPHYTPHLTPPAPEPRWSPGWIALLTVCVLLGLALVVVIVLGATGVIFNVDCAAAKLQAGATAASSSDAALPLTARAATLQKFPENSIEHVILKVPVYDPVAVSRAEEQNLTREQPVLRQVARESKFEPVTPPPRPKPHLSITLPSSDEVRRAPHPPNPPRMLPFHPEPGAPSDEQVPVKRSQVSSATLDRQQQQHNLPLPDASATVPPLSGRHSDDSGSDSFIHPSDVHELSQGTSLERRVVIVPPVTDDPASGTHEEAEVVERQPTVADEELGPFADLSPTSPNNTAQQEQQQQQLWAEGRSNTPYTEPDFSGGTSVQACNGLQRFIEYVVYINLDENPTKRAEIEHEIDKLGLPEFIPRERLSAVKRSNTELGSFLSKIACLTKALSLKKNALILEDDFRLDQTPAEMLDAFSLVEEQMGNRWDVIALAQHVDEWQKVCEKGDVRIMRVLHGRRGTGLLVNKLYVPRLLAFWIQSLRAMLQKDQHHHEHQIAQIKSDLQRWDMWLTFFFPLGHQAEQAWHYLDDMEHATDAAGVCQKITLWPQLERKRIAVCHLATGKYNQFVTAIQTDCYLKFLKMHHLEFFLFTDQASNYPDRTEEGAVLHTYAVESRGYPQDNLYRFHYLLQAEAALRAFDYVYYMDVDYRLYQHPAEKQLLVTGVVATAHLHNIVEKRDGSRRHAGLPEIRPESAAALRPDETMTVYYASSFHGGSSAAYLELCQAVQDSIDLDLSRNITAQWLDESYLNRFLLDHPPANVLSQSYIFSERCLDLECRDPMCNALRESRIQPIMGTQL